MVLENDGSPQPSSRHVGSLDGVRGIAILIVMLHHFLIVIPGGTPARNILKSSLNPGWSGVDLFFVLSGFLITGILLDTKEAVNYFQSFYARRVLRIFPLYYAVLGVIVVVANVLYQPWFDQVMALRQDQVYYFFYLNNWWFLLHDTWHSNIIGHFWTLAIEEQFYLIWPICIWLVPRGPRQDVLRHVFRIALSGCALAFALRVVLICAYGPSHAIDQNTFARMDTLLAGACCAVVVRDERMRARAKAWLGPMMAIGLAGMLWIDFGMGELWRGGAGTESAGFTLLALGYSAFVLKAYLERDSGSRMQRILESGWLRKVGKYSYGMYVLHVPLLTVADLLMKAYFGPEAPLPAALTIFTALLLITFAAAAVSYETFEKYFLGFRSNFAPVFEPAGRKVGRRAEAVSL